MRISEEREGALRIRHDADPCGGLVPSLATLGAGFRHVAENRRECDGERERKVIGDIFTLAGYATRGGQRNPSDESLMSSLLKSLANGPKRARRLLRSGLALPFLLLVAVLASEDWISRWTGLSHPASIALLLVVVAATLWITEAIPLFTTSFLLLFLEIAWLQPSMESAGFDVTSGTFLSPFFSNVILLFLGGFALSTAFRRFHLDNWMARLVLRRAGTKPKAVLLAVLLTTAFLSMWMSNTATAAMMLGLTLPLLEQTRETDPYRRGLPLAVALGANFGGLGTPIGTPPNAIVIESLARANVQIGFATWMVMAAPFLLLFLSLSYVVLTRMFPPEIGVLEFEGSGEKMTLTGKNGIIVVTTVITGLLWLTSGIHPLKTGTVALLPVIVFFGGRLLSREDFQNLPWDVLMLAGGGLSLGAAVETSGLGEAIVVALPTEHLTSLALIGALIFVAGAMTTFMSNTATANLLVPVAFGLSSVDSSVLLVSVAYACSCTMILPVSTPPNAMVFSSGQIRTSDLVRPALIVSGVALLATGLVGPIWWSWVRSLLH